MRIGFVQTKPEFGETEKNTEGMIRFIDRNKKADLLVFPELCTTGYLFRNRRELKQHSESVPSGPFAQKIIQAAKENNSFVVFGIAEKSRGKIYSDSVLVGPNGFISKLRKIHLFLNEKKIFNKGNLPYKTDNVKNASIGMGVCWDHIFPEVWRALALQKADIFCLPTNLVTDYCQRNMQVRSVENGCFSIVANRIGTERGQTFKGDSIIFDNRGKILVKAGKKKEECCVVKINPKKARDKMVTKTNDLFNDRRPEFYKL